MTEDTLVEVVKHIREQLHIARRLVAEMYEYTFVYPGCPTVEWGNQENVIESTARPASQEADNGL